MLSVVLVALLGLAGGSGTQVSDEVFITDVGAGPEAELIANNSPTAVINPQDRDNVVVVHLMDAPGFSARLHYSRDGGRTWSSTDLPLPEGTGNPEGPPLELTEEGEVRFVETQRPYAPDVAFGPDGTLYVAYVNLMGRGNVPDNLWLARSEDGGATLSEPVRVAGERVFQTRVVVDPDGVVHLTYMQADDIGVWALASPPTLVATRSEDGGETFSDPVPFSDPARPRVAAATPVIDADGDLVVLYQDFKDNVRDFQNLEGPAWEGTSALVLTRSTDGGRTFSPGVEIDDEVVVGQRFIVFLPEFPSITAAPDGTLYVAWADARAGSRDVLLRRSVDGGDSWSAPVRVHDHPADDETAQYLPRVAATDDGRVAVLYVDQDDTDGAMATTRVAVSADGAAPFETRQLSSRAFDATIGPRPQAAHVEPGVGARLGLAAWDGSLIAVWTDTRIGEDRPELVRQDIAATRVRLPDPPAEADITAAPWSLVLIAAAAVALLALVLVVRRRRAGRR